MATDNNPNNNQNFDLEEIVLNTNQSQEKTPENKKKNSNKSGTSNTRENKIKKERNKDKEETIDDILEEEENQKNRSRIIIVIIIALLGFGLMRLIRHKNGNNDTKNTTQDIISNNTGKTNEETTNNSGADPLSKFLKKNNNKSLISLGGDYNYDKEKHSIYYKHTVLQDADKDSFEVLGKNYAKDQYHVYYQGNKLENINPEQFKVMQNNGKYKLTGIVVNSKNLLNYLKIRQNREFLMTTIASITNKNTNVKRELTQSSVYAMDGFKNEFDELNQLQRGDNMTPLQRAKFGVIFLYIKLIKSLETDKIRMSKAKEELKYFIQHHDTILQNYGPEKEKKTSLQGDLGYDEYCIYTNGKLSACFLNKIFVHQD